MMTQTRNTKRAIAVGISLAASIYLAPTSVAPVEAKEVESAAKTPSELSQDHPGCSEEYPTLAAGILVMLHSRYGPKPKEEGREGGALAQGQAPCTWLPRSRTDSSEAWVERLPGRSGTLHTHPLGNEVGVPWWLVNTGSPCQSCWGVRDNGWRSSRGVEATATTRHRIPVP